MTETIPLWTARMADITPAAVARVYRHAAELIRTEGYSPHAVRGSGMREFSAEAAIEDGCYKCHPAVPAAAADLAEEAVTRLVGFLYLAGQLTRRTNIYDVTCQLANWEQALLDRPRGFRRRSQAEAIAVLDAAAAATAALGMATS